MTRRNRSGNDGDQRHRGITVDEEEFRRLVPGPRAAVLTAKVRGRRCGVPQGSLPEARSALKAVLDEAPGSVTARELSGLTHYRLGNFREAAKQLEAYRELAPGSVDQHPVLADCYRCPAQVEARR